MAHQQIDAHTVEPQYIWYCPYCQEVNDYAEPYNDKQGDVVTCTECKHEFEFSGTIH